MRYNDIYCYTGALELSYKMNDELTHYASMVPINKTV